MSKPLSLSQLQQTNKTITSSNKLDVKQALVEKNKAAAKDQLFAIKLMLARTQPLPDRRK